jgi:hypothetical protein
MPAEHEGRDGRVLASFGAAAMGAEIETGQVKITRFAARGTPPAIGGCGGRSARRVTC